MYYPAFVEQGDELTAYSVVLPDFPGCFSAADTIDELPDRVQQAVELYFEGENMALPLPSLIDSLQKLPEYHYKGVWMLFDIDIQKLSE